MHANKIPVLREPAVRAGDDILFADEPGKVLDPPRHQVRVLDDVGRLRDQARDQDLAFRQLQILPDLNFVFVARIGRFEAVGLGLELEHGRRNLAQRDVLRMGPVATAAAPVRPHPLLGNAA
jgi:hypothetical protein